MKVCWRNLGPQPKRRAQEPSVYRVRGDPRLRKVYKSLEPTFSPRHQIIFPLKLISRVQGHRPTYASSPSFGDAEAPSAEWLTSFQMGSSPLNQQ